MRSMQQQGDYLVFYYWMDNAKQSRLEQTGCHHQRQEIRQINYARTGDLQAKANQRPIPGV
jgi:hypothetical protein